MSKAPIFELEWSQKKSRAANGEKYIDNRLMDMERGEERVRRMERVIWKLTLPYVK